jgi:hypothetical protein
MKTIVSNVLLVAVMLLWVVGVDYMPVMKVLGLPLFIGAYALWVRWSPVANQLCKLLFGEGYDE